MGFEHVVFERPQFMGCLDVLDGLILVQERFVGSEAEGLAGNGKYAIVLHREDGYVGRQSGLQLEVTVRCGDDYLIGNHIALGGGLLANLLDSSLKGVVGEGVNGKSDALANLHVTDVCLVDISNDAHIGEVLRDGKEFRRVKGGGHCLTFLHGLGKHHAIDGRGDGGVTEVGLSPAHTLFGRIHLLLGLLIAEPGVLEIVSANQTFAVERLVASEIGFLIIEVALLAVEVGLSRIEFADKVGLIKFGYDLTFPHHTVVIHIEMGHNT